MGWEYHPFGFLLSDSIGGDWGKDLPGNDHVEQVAIIRGTDVPDITAGGTGKVPIRYTTKKKLDSRILRDGDMVIEVSGGSPTQPTGRSLFISQSILDRFAVPVVCASFCRRFRPRSLQTGIFAAQHLSFLYEIGGTWEYQNQSTGISNFQTTHFLEAEKIAWPGDKIIDAFAKVVEPLIRLSTRNENCALIQTRDLLLPKLMSGEIRLRDAEKLVEQVA
jgi:type I restriction enzyme S subunit